MNSFISFLFFLFLAASAPLLAEEVPRPPGSLELTDIFNVVSDPGEGTLMYVKQKIPFGVEGGHYGVGMIFPGKSLPDPYRADFANFFILQLALGTLKDRLEGRIPQFGAATLILKKIPTGKTKLNFVLPSGKEKNLAASALLLFSSPSLKADATDELKLRESHFATGGILIVSPVGEKSSVLLKSAGQSVQYWKQKMSFDFAGRLATPFGNEVRDLSGKIEIPVYWPKSKGAEELAKRLAEQSLNPYGHPGLPQAAPPSPKK
jgi:hypothetical protein